MKLSHASLLLPDLIQLFLLALDGKDANMY